MACFLGPIDSEDRSHTAALSNIHTIRFSNAPVADAVSWEEIIKTTPPLSTNPQRGTDDIATVIYTSGTTGSPKGAMHRFGAFPHFAAAICQVSGRIRGAVMLSSACTHCPEERFSETVAVLPLLASVSNESTSTFLTDLKRAESGTVFFSVPRLYAKFQQKVFAQCHARRSIRCSANPC